tara:strand:- start:601 stop:981 length:381 start_codon:yes stop_codon:yes gene_type:complete
MIIIFQMNKLAIIPIFFLTMCGTAPITGDPAEACSLPLDGSPANCPDTLNDIKLPRREVKGEVNIYDPYHWNTLHGVYIDNLRKSRIEQTATKPSDSINKAIAEFNNGSNDTTESEELLQLPSRID